MSKATKSSKTLNEFFGDKSQDVRVIMPKAFLANLSTELDKSNKRISDAVTKNDNKELIKILIEDNQELKGLMTNLENAIRESRVDQVEILNLQEPQEIEIPEYPAEIDIKKPKWYQKFDDTGLKTLIKNGFEFLGKQLNLDKYKDKKNALAVRLVDKTGKSFYDAMFQAISGSVPNFMDTHLMAYNGDTGKWQGVTGHAFNGDMTVDTFPHEADTHVPLGEVTGHSSVNKFGRNSNVDTGTTEEIWDGSRVYVFPTTASITHIRSAVDSAITQGVVCEVQGLDTNWDLVVQNVTTDPADSETEIELGTALRRVFRVKVLDDTSLDQDIWVGPNPATAANSSAIVQAGNNQTLMAIYTVPNGKTAVMTNYYISVNPATGKDPTSMPVRMWARDNENGYAPQLKHVQGLVAGYIQQEFHPHYRFNQQTDIYFDATPVGKPADVSLGFDLILIDNN